MSFTLFMTKALSFLMSIFITIIPYTGFSSPNFKAKNPDEIRLNAALVSDVHFEPSVPLRKAFLKTAIYNLKNGETKTDLMIAAGDITNYADYESLISYYETVADSANFPVITAAGNHDIGHAGDRDVVSYSREEAMEYFIYYHNLYTGDNIDKTYWSQTVKGYKFIVLGDEVINGGRWDAVTMSTEQIEWLDRELDSANGQPVFVICHWPGDSTTGEDIIWDGSGVDFEANPIKDILESHKNVVFISGHMHGGIRATVIGSLFDMPMAEKVNGVIYLNLPTFGIINQYGIPWSGMGAMMEVYDSSLNFRPVNFLTGRWYSNSAYSFDFD